jgi:DNA repair exonuclease SbcCD ATPase subunit
LLVAIPLGCEKPVSEDQPAQSFARDARARITTLERRIDTIKSDADDAAPTVKATVEQRTEMAEEKLETLRESSIPALEAAVGEDDIASLKDTINDSLESVQDDIDKARSALEEGNTERENYVLDTRQKINGLEGDLEAIQQKVGELSGAAEAQYKQSREAAEEAIDEARSQLDGLEDASEEQASEYKDNIESLIDQAKTNIDALRDQVAQN